MTRLEFLEKARNIHGYKYKYPNLNDKITLKDKIEIFLEEDSFTQTVSKHLMGKCPEKQINKRSSQDFIEEGKDVWGEKYDYSLVEYKGSLSEVKIILDGFIYSQRASSHLQGISPEFRKLKEHSDLENSDMIGEKEIEDFLLKYKIPHQKNKRFGCLKFQFYLTEIRTVIEYQSQLHSNLQNVIDWNNKKRDYCEENFINLIRIKYDQENIIWELLWDNLKLFINNKEVDYVKFR
jgi:hypothetical protein